MIKTTITKRSEDYTQWYLDVIAAAELIDESSVKGAMIFRPYGYAIWERMQQVLDREIKKSGAQNTYFPLFIPKSLLTKEAHHVEGFAKESAVVTHYRLLFDKEKGELVVDPKAKLAEEMIVRPTSETIMYEAFARWIHSWRDLPLKINQWANVVRWEMRTRPFLRTSEFLWQEGHTAHATLEEADREARDRLEMYKTFAEGVLAMPVLTGEKPAHERFPGADHTYTIEAMMQDGKALQAGTSHNLGQNFAKAFNIVFQNKEGKNVAPSQTSWGVSTRLIGGLIMTHSDDDGLVLPPNIAPYQVVVVPVWKTDEEKGMVLSKVGELVALFEGADLRVKLDDRDFLNPGAKFYEWERKGVPVRLEIGPRDLAKDSVVVVRRDTKEKMFVANAELLAKVQQVLADMQTELFEKAKTHRDSATVAVETYEEFKAAIEKGCFVLAHWDGTGETAEKIKTETKATIRCAAFDTPKEPGKCVLTGKPSTQRVYFAKVY